MSFHHHHHHCYGNNPRFLFRLLSLSWKNTSMSRHSHHHKIGKSSTNIKTLCRLILWVNTAMFLTAYMKTTGWAYLRPTLTKRTASTPVHTIRIQAYINKYLGLITLHHSEDQKESQGGTPIDDKPFDIKPIDDKQFNAKSDDVQPMVTSNDALVSKEDHQDYSTCSLQGGGRHNQTQHR